MTQSVKCPVYVPLSLEQPPLPPKISKSIAQVFAGSVYDLTYVPTDSVKTRCVDEPPKKCQNPVGSSPSAPLHRLTVEDPGL